MKPEAIKTIQYLKSFKGSHAEHWTPRYGNCVGYWTYRFGEVSIEYAICIHVLYSGTEVACFHPDQPEHTAICKALTEARDGETTTARTAFLAM
jgi:hypothetical protein